MFGIFRSLHHRQSSETAATIFTSLMLSIEVLGGEKASLAIVKLQWIKESKEVRGNLARGAIIFP